MSIKNKKEKQYSDQIHSLHPYPCKFPGTTAKSLINDYGKPGDIVCDPFVGSGTTLVEATLCGMSSIGVDINPIACLISKVKATPMKECEMSLLKEKYLAEAPSFFDYSAKNNYEDQEIFHYPSIDHWFQDNVITELSCIKTYISNIAEDNIKDLFNAVMSSIIVRVSNQESDTRYAAIDKKIKNGHTFKLFLEKLTQFTDSVENYVKVIPNKNVDVSVYVDDTRTLKSVKDQAVDLIITSPPYANTYDYYLYHKHRKYWLGMDVKSVMENEIGSRREYSSLKRNPSKWVDDAKLSMRQIYRIMRPKGKLFLIIGDSVINKELIDNGKLFNDLGEKNGLRHVSTDSISLELHSSAFNPSFQSKRKKEHLIYFEKP